MSQPQIVITNTAPASDNILTDVEAAATYVKRDQSTPQENTGTLTFPTAKFGSTDNNTEFESDGSMKANGTATTYRDELQDLIKAAGQNPASSLVWDYAEGTLDFKNTCDLNTYAVMNIQINHDWKFGSNIEPHIHWFQNENKTPNWLLQYRWQKNGEAKTTAWTYLPYNQNAFIYTSGTIVQITSFGTITPPEGYGISDVVQFRIIRDVDNDSTEMDGLDTYTGDAEALSFDIHIECDTLGSRQRYVK